MFDKSARWFFPGQDVQGIINHLGGALYSAGITIAPSGPMRWQGLGSEVGYGIAPKVIVSVMPDQGGFWLDVRLWADLSSGSIVLLILFWFFFFPAAIIYLVLGHSNWQERSQYLLHTMFSSVGHLQGTPGWAQPPQYMPPAPQPPR